MTESRGHRGGRPTVREKRPYLDLRTAETWQGYVDMAVRALQGVEGDVYGLYGGDEIVVSYALDKTEYRNPSRLLIFSPGCNIQFRMMDRSLEALADISVWEVDGVSVIRDKLVISGTEGMLSRYNVSLTLGRGGDVSYSAVPKLA